MIALHAPVLRRWWRPMAAVAAALALTPLGSAKDLAELFAKGPYIQLPGVDGVTIMWESATNHPAIVRYGQGRKLDQAAEAPAPRQLKGITTVTKSATVPAASPGAAPVKTNITILQTNTFFVYETTLSGLEAGRRYSYEVEVAGAHSPRRSFKTFSANPEAVRFLVYGDSRSNPKIHANLARQFRRHEPEFILHTGDLVGRGAEYSQWLREFFAPLRDVIDEVPFFPSIGNHEGDGTNYLAYFHLPGKERWYSLDIGPVHVLALDFHYEASTNEQFEFARQDLAQTQAPWKLVLLHYPVFNLGGHATAWGHTNYLPLFHQTKVDLVLAGHSHIYERFRPVAPSGDPEAWPLTCITTGGGGASLYASFDHPALLSRETTNHYVIFDATRDTLRGKALRANGTVLDRFELRKSGGQLAPDYLALLHPEESLRLFWEAAPSLAGKAALLPSTTNAAPMMLTVAARKPGLTPARLEITLAPESAPFYRLEDSPVRVTTPPASMTNQVFWARVRATGKKPITKEKNDDLTPPLIFQATVTAPEGQTVARGVRARYSEAAEKEARKVAGLAAD
jgi:hypothetical protein